MCYQCCLVDVTNGCICVSIWCKKRKKNSTFIYHASGPPLGVFVFDWFHLGTPFVAQTNQGLCISFWSGVFPCPFHKVASEQSDFVSAKLAFDRSQGNHAHHCPADVLRYKMIPPHAITSWMRLPLTTLPFKKLVFLFRTSPQCTGKCELISQVGDRKSSQPVKICIRNGSNVAKFNWSILYS